MVPCILRCIRTLRGLSERDPCRGLTVCDVEEARKLLSSYISLVTRKALKFVRDNETDDQQALINQIRACNEIISTLSESLDEQEFRQLKIEEEDPVGIDLTDFDSSTGSDSDMDI